MAEVDVTLTLSIDGGAPQTGGLEIALGSTVQMSAISKAGWSGGPTRWEIFSFPPDFALPAGWTEAADGTYYVLGNDDPPPFDADPWGKYLTRVVVAGTLVDERTMVSVLSTLGTPGIARREGSQFGGHVEVWVGELKRAVHTLDQAIVDIEAVTLSNATPAAPSGAGSAGVATTASRADHVHPASAGSSLTGDPNIGLTATGSVRIAAESALPAAVAGQVRIHSEAGIELADNNAGDVTATAAGGAVLLDGQGSGESYLLSGGIARISGPTTRVGTDGTGGVALIEVGYPDASGTHVTRVRGREVELRGTLTTSIDGATCTIGGTYATTLSLSASHVATSNGQILDWVPLVPDYTEPADHPEASATYSSAALVYSSSIDPAYEITASRVYDTAIAAEHALAGTYMPILLMLHGYSGTTGSWADTERLRMTDKGYFVITAAKRGDESTPHSAGGADDARDRQDIVDAIAAAVAAHPTFLDGACVDIFGVSGGSYDALTLVTKYPGRFRNVLATQLGGDLGVNPGAEASYWGTDDNRTEVEARVGTRASSIQPYRARNAMTSLADALRQSTTKLIALWDAQDPIGVTMRSVRTALEQGRVPRSQWYCEESDTGDTLRWEHGYPATVTDLLSALDALAHRIDDPAPTAATTGEYIVTGHCVSAAGWEVWTADTGSTNCKNDSTGGREHVVRVIYDAASGQFWVEPLSGACAVSVLWGGDILTQDIS